MWSSNKPELRVEDLIESLEDCTSPCKMFNLLGSFYISQNNIRRFEKLVFAAQLLRGEPCITRYLSDEIYYLVAMQVLYPPQEWINLTHRKYVKTI